MPEIIIILILSLAIITLSRVARAKLEVPWLRWIGFRGATAQRNLKLYVYEAVIFLALLMAYEVATHWLHVPQSIAGVLALIGYVILSAIITSKTLNKPEHARQ